MKGSYFASFLGAALFFGFFPSGLQAALPSLTIKGQGKTEKLELREMSLSVELEGALAETVLELEFFNHTTRMQEGEFVLQLPEGATVSTYALEVNGKMRPGVSVDKEQARNAYESIKRRMVDPGLVEREAGNTYRTRIFPILGKQTKRVRIGYLQELKKADFRFELKDGQKIKAFTCRVRGGEKAELELPGIKEADDPEPGLWEWTGANVTLNGELKAFATLPKEREVIQRVERSPDGVVHFVVQGMLADDWKPRERAKPKRIRVLWDASRSGRWRDHEAELKALDRFLKWAGDTEVIVQLLRNELGRERKFLIRNGKIDGVLDVLKAVGYDGAADFSQINDFEGTTLLFTDGEISSPVWTFWGAGLRNDPFAIPVTERIGRKANLPVQRIPKNRHLEHPFFVMVAGGLDGGIGLERAGAVVVDFGKKEWWEGLTKILDGVSITGPPKAEWDLKRDGNRYLVTGRLPKGNAAEGVVIRPDGGSPNRVKKSDASKVDSNWTFVRRVWAQRRLSDLEREGDKNSITDFSIAERLVSDHTSLIVLERFEDHIRYRIPPPEPDLLTRYEAELEENVGTARSKALTLWRNKLSWHRTEYPWIDWKLAEEVGTVGVWVKAMKTAFPEEKQNQKLLNPYDTWLLTAKEVVEAKATLKTEKDFDGWRAGVGRSVQQLKKIRETPVPDTKGGQPVHVSVRGFVNRRGVFSGDAPLLLREAIKKAGGPHIPWGSLSKVYLYRNAQRTGYNLESQQYQPVPLRWGDMVVVETEGRGFQGDTLSAGGPVDPFASPAAGGAGSERQPMANQPAVFEEPGTGAGPQAGQAGLPAGFGAPGRASASASRNMKIKLVSREPEELATGVDQAVVKALRASKAPAAEYEKLVAGVFRKAPPSSATLVAISRLLIEKGEVEMGVRVISNLMEILANKIEATRAFALWLDEFGQSDSAEALLKSLMEAVTDEATRAVIQYDLARLNDERNDFGTVVLREIESRNPSGLAAISLTDYFGNDGEPQGELRAFEANRMRSDVRIVVATAGDPVQLAVREPGAAKNVQTLGLSVHGGRIESSPRVQEYQMRHGLPGTYEVICRRPKGGKKFAGVELSTDDLPPITLRVTYYTRWGTEAQTEQTKTLLMDGGELSLDGILFGWGE